MEAYQEEFVKLDLYFSLVERLFNSKWAESAIATMLTQRALEAAQDPTVSVDAFAKSYNDSVAIFCNS